MGWVDIALLAILAVSVLVGFMRGLVFEILSLLGWVAAYFTAYWVGPYVALHIPLGHPGSPLNQGVSFGGSFIVALLIWGLFARLLRSLVRASPLSGIDRILGGGFGAVRGLLLLFVIVTVAALTPMASSAGWRQSQGAAWLNPFLQDLKPALPPEVTRYLPA
jgi:membrane protein required for colicin V production